VGAFGRSHVLESHIQLEKPNLAQDQAFFSPSLPMRRNEAPRVSVIIVVWNAMRYVLECLDSLQEYCGSVCTEVIIVDNASTDGTPDLVEKRYPNFKLIRNPENYGFAKANNIGILQCSGDYICLVNSDVAFIDDCISPMIKCLSESPEVALIGPKMLGPDGDVRRSTMRFPTVWNNFSRALGFDLLFPHSGFWGGLLMADFDHQRTMPVEVLNGWFVVVRREALEQVGLLDTQFFMYGEDVDWCYRFRKAGRGIVFFSDAAAIHYGGSSSASAPIRFSTEMLRANLQYWRKHHGWPAQQMFLVSLAVFHLGRAVGFAFSYLWLPSKRPNVASKLKRSLASLRWTALAMSGMEDTCQVRP
jgi:GT2 family glycosyltransferase